MNTENRKFWLWWKKNEALIRRVLEQGSAAKLEELKGHIDHKILSFGNFTWEITAGELKAYCLTISPNRDIDLLQLSRQIISEAPRLSHWEFAYAKAPETKLMPIKVYDANADPVQLNPEYWQINLENDCVKIIADELKSLDEETQYYAMDLVVTAHYGEEFRIQEIRKIILL